MYVQQYTTTVVPIVYWYYFIISIIPSIIVRYNTYSVFLVISSWLLQLVVVVLQCCCLHIKPSIHRHQQYTQCPSWFILERYKLSYGHRLWEKTKNYAGNREFIMAGKWNANVPGTRRQQTRQPGKKELRKIKQIKQKESWDDAEYKWQEEHVLAEEEQMTAARTKQYEDKRTGKRRKKRKEVSKAKKQESVCSRHR